MLAYRHACAYILTRVCCISAWVHLCAMPAFAWACASTGQPLWGHMGWHGRAALYWTFPRDRLKSAALGRRLEQETLEAAGKEASPDGDEFLTSAKTVA